MEDAEHLTKEEDFRRSLEAIRLTCEEMPNEILCPEGLKLKESVIFQIDYVGHRLKLDEKDIDIARLQAKEMMWDRACAYADEGKMLRWQTEEIYRLKKELEYNSSQNKKE